ncbi:cysteine-rich CWC family protein [Aquabacterium sp. J223]|uniref:cysteine-rich CWC family protein n=1 Tax=Aquabacterium sp. J223 TaxID=2898431 RepID=UPI0021AD9D72|nr:cysteine-rich CWC family protein [Aquabacterium sp. J223]UUX95657.1 cysteine-rich CWC family protein [Aquabacterium sp. J223]
MTPVADRSHDVPAQAGRRCPLCQGDNRCMLARATGASVADCWCAGRRIAASTLAAVPLALRGRACLCARCANPP